jgi:hypothetical protein
MAMIMVVLYRQEENHYDYQGRMTSEAGTVWVSHGIDTRTGRNVILPGDKWRDFQHNCALYEGEWYLK